MTKYGSGWREGGVAGGPGDDIIEAAGRLDGGPGDDTIRARTWGASHLIGGPGNDTLGGSRRRDTFNPGPGMDQIFPGGVANPEDPDEVIRTRDGEMDYVICSDFHDGDLRAYIDGFDQYPRYCAHVYRRGAARALPATDPFAHADLGPGKSGVEVVCAVDGQRVCVGSVTLSRGNGSSSASGSASGVPASTTIRNRIVRFRASREKLRAMYGKVKVTVRSRVPLRGFEPPSVYDPPTDPATAHSSPWPARPSRSDAESSASSRRRPGTRFLRRFRLRSLSRCPPAARTTRRRMTSRGNPPRAGFSAIAPAGFEPSTSRL